MAILHLRNGRFAGHFSPRPCAFHADRSGTERGMREKAGATSAGLQPRDRCRTGDLRREVLKSRSVSAVDFQEIISTWRCRVPGFFRHPGFEHPRSAWVLEAGVRRHSTIPRMPATQLRIPPIRPSKRNCKGKNRKPQEKSPDPARRRFWILIHLLQHILRPDADVRPCHPLRHGAGNRRRLARPQRDAERAGDDPLVHWPAHRQRAGTA